jgi:hypothetical protein
MRATLGAWKCREFERPFLQSVGWAAAALWTCAGALRHHVGAQPGRPWCSLIESGIGPGAPLRDHCRKRPHDVWAICRWTDSQSPVWLINFVCARILGLAAAIHFSERKTSEVAMRQVETSDRNKAQVGPTDVDRFLAPYREALDRLRRPVVRIGLEPFAEDSLTASKVAGRAWWPECEAAPKGEDAADMTLLSQTNVSEVPALAGYPLKGLLQFFIVATDVYGANFDDALSLANLGVQRNFRVVYWPDLSRQAKAPAIASSDILPQRPDAPGRMRGQGAHDANAQNEGSARFMVERDPCLSARQED